MGEFQKSPVNMFKCFGNYLPIRYIQILLLYVLFLRLENILSVWVLWVNEETQSAISNSGRDLTLRQNNVLQKSPTHAIQKMANILTKFVHMNI